ncbi:MAG TPA: hypothetical protein VM889_10690 [Candidatus Thermoplasmatota archaeon]|nr:hypothetical protein [Candidatus Thermoplasmatota archaeon]
MDLGAIERTTLLIDAASGFLFLALGLWILTLRPRRTVTLALGAYASLLGVTVALRNLGTELGWLPKEAFIPEGLSLVAASAALLVITHYFPEGLQRRHRAAGFPVALGLAAVILAAGIGALSIVASRIEVDLAFLIAAMTIFWAATWFAVATLTARYHEVEDGEARKGLLILTIAVVLEPAVRTGIMAASYPHTTALFFQLMDSAFAASTLVLTALWVRNTRTADPDARRRARNMALLLPGLALAGALFAVATDPLRAFNLGPMGLSRIAGVLLLAWAILRGLIPGVDAKVRWGISKSTLAAAFIGVFFVASEAAQEFFGETLGSAYVGIAAAGALVFAMAPLQRLAEHVAATAVPSTRAVPVEAPASATSGMSPAESALASSSGTLAEREAAYRRAVAWALRDGALSRAEERQLLEIGHFLGLPPLRAAAILDEMEAAARA